MIHSRTFDFLSSLKAHNDKAWFDARRSDYEAARDDFMAFIEKLLPAFETIEPMVAEQQPKDCIYRLYRDVRFSKDKTPYKTHFGAYFARGGRKWDGAGYYLHLEPGNSFAGGGLWMPQPSLLKKVRQEIDYDWEGFSAITGSKDFRKYFSRLEGESLSRPPKGYEADNPAIEILKMKSFTASHPVSDAQLRSGKALEAVTRSFQSLQPLVQFLNRALDA